MLKTTDTSILTWKKVLIFSIVLLISLSLFNPQQMMISVSPVIRVIENQILLYRVRGYREFQTEHFTIKHENIDPNMLQLVASTAEDKYIALKEIFQYEPKGKINLVIHHNPNKMMSVTMLKKGTPPMGVYYADSVHILDPEQLFQVNLEENFYKEGPVLHELAHLFTDHIARGNYPMWFTEGVSLYLEYAVDGYEWGKGTTISEEEYDITNLTKTFSQLDEYMAYTQSFRLVKGFVDKHGEDELMKLINELGKGKPLKSYYHMF